MYQLSLVHLLSILPSLISFYRYFLSAFPQGFIGGGVIVHGPVADYGIVLVGLLVVACCCDVTCTPA
jgi:hypothetical protein